MKVQILVLALVVALARPLVSATVSPKTIVQIEPHQFSYGVFFDAGGVKQVLQDHCYSYTVNHQGFGFNAVTQETIVADLRRTGALLLYAGHGSSVGTVFGEVYQFEADAIEGMNDLIDVGIVKDYEVEVKQIPEEQSGYAIGLKKTFTDEEPANRDVAVIASCYGELAGDFNASCKLGGIGLCGIAALKADWQCLVMWLQTANWKTFDLAKLNCGYGFDLLFNVESGDWQLFRDFTPPLPDCDEASWGWIKSLYDFFSWSTSPVLALSSDVNTLVWDSPDANSQLDTHIFKWEDGDDPDAAAMIGTVASDDTVFVDGDVSAGVTYHYRVANEDGETLVDLGTAAAGLILAAEANGEPEFIVQVVDLVVHGNHAFVALSDAIVRYNISNPSEPVETGRRNLGDLSDLAL